MKMFNSDEIKEIIRLHQLWVISDKNGVCADLRSANLSGADLSGANLSGADLRSAYLSGADLRSAYLRSANLSGADLSGADLRSAYLRSAYLSGANLSGAYLSGANLRSANLSGANLRSAYLSGANLSGANLSGADLSGAYLRSANLRSADLSGANLSGANLSGAYLSGADLSMFEIVGKGDIEVFKKLQNGVIATLLIPKKARRVNAYSSRKCRAEYAKVIEIRDINNKKIKEEFGLHDSKFKYCVGKLIRPDSFDNDPRVECSNGIHFFITKQEAQNYNG